MCTQYQDNPGKSPASEWPIAVQVTSHETIMIVPATSLSSVRSTLTRISHTRSTAPAQGSGVQHRPCDPRAGARDPQAGAPGLLNVPYSTFAGASVARRGTPSDRSFRRFANRRSLGLSELKFLGQATLVITTIFSWQEPEQQISNRHSY